MGNTFGFYNLIYRGVDFVNEEEYAMRELFRTAWLEELYKMREILLHKKATPDNIRKLEQIDELIEEKSKRTEYLKKSIV